MSKKYLFWILIVSAVLTVFGLNRGDVVNDEVFYGFRAIGMLDYVGADYQPTPLQQFDGNIPWWTKLSFHDHPPLVFLVQNISMKIFGENVWAFRLPSAIFGIASVYLLYLIGTLLVSPTAGIAAAAAYGLTLNHIFISRSGLQEAQAIFFGLLASYFFLRAFEKNTHFVWAGVAIGFGMLSKYTFVVFPFLFLAYLLVFKRTYLADTKFWLGILAAMAVFSPVLIYNAFLYRATGHFDFQFSYIFGQHVPEWSVTPGKEIGTLSDRARNFLPQLARSNSWLFLAASAAAILGFSVSLVRTGLSSFRKYGFVIIGLVSSVLLISAVGPAYRFLSIFTPFLALAIGIFVAEFFESSRNEKWKRIFAQAFIVFLVFEAWYSFNNQVRFYPEGPSPWLSSKVRYENYNWGYHELDAYLEKELRGKFPALTADPAYEFLDDLREEAIAHAEYAHAEPKAYIFVYGDAMDLGARLWTFGRRLIYHAWPTISESEYAEELRTHGSDRFERIGFQREYVILPTSSIPAPEIIKRVKGIAPVEIKNKRGSVAFEVYILERR